MDFEEKILKHARDSEDANALENIVHKVVEGKFSYPK